jgi:hypothetical protein
VAMLLTATMLAWLVANGGEGVRIASARRELVERYFVTNAGSFVVGWGWVVVLRDLSSAASTAIDHWLGGDPQAQELAFFSEAATVVLFGPVLSVLLLVLHARSGGSQRGGEGERVGGCGGGCCCCRRLPPADNPTLQGAVEEDQAHSQPADAGFATSSGALVPVAGGGPPSSPPSSSSAAVPRVAFEGGGERSMALGRAVHQCRMRLLDEGSGGYSGGHALTSDVESLPLPASASGVGARGLRLGPLPAAHGMRQTLLGGGGGHPTTATDGGGVTAVRASHREQLLASLIDSDPALSAASSRPQSRGASRVPSQSATPRASLSSSSFTHPGANP